MKNIGELNLGFSDAQNYLQRENKQMFSDVFVKNSYLDDILNTSTYFLLGEKGTGKTAYAAYLSNNEQQGHKSVLKFISGTDYEKFYELKKAGRIDISGYTDIWKTILMLLLAKSITENTKLLLPFSKSNIFKLMEAVDDYYNKAFSPEIVNALKIIDNSEIAAKLICQYAEVGGSSCSQYEFTEMRMQMNLFYICQKFSESLSKIKLSKNIILFIDGIDVRPSQIPYNEYLNCIKGLANACWTLNTEIFSNVRDTQGRLKIVLLLRPDIYNSLNMQNSINKLSDNSVLLEWKTTYIEYPNSALFQMANKLLSYNQETESKFIWKDYFDWRIKTTNDDREYDDAFMEFLKISLSRPRDIQQILKILQGLMVRKNEGSSLKFNYNVYNTNEFQNSYSEYFLGSLKDQLAFYYSDEDYEFFKKFFDLFTDPQFTYEQYIENYNKYIEYILDNAKEIPDFMEDANTFLQMLYDNNVIAAIEKDGDNVFFHFSYREKNATNISPKVPYSIGLIYRFHYGLYKKAKFGRY